ncbi:MAG: TolC family protein [Stenotrophobium sp.]
MFIIKYCLSLLAFAGLGLLTGCATVPADRGFSDVQSLLTARGGPRLSAPVTGTDADAASGQPDALIQNLLDKTLSAQDAIRIALLRNPRLQAEYARLGIASSAVLEAGRLSNPVFSVSALRPNAAAETTQLTLGLAQNFADLLMLPSRQRLAAGEFERSKVDVGGNILTLAAEVESAYYTLIGAQQVAAMRHEVTRAAQVSSDLAQRFFDAGNITALALNLEQAAAAQAQLDALSADAQAVDARAALNVLMGLPASETRWSVPDRLPLPPDEDSDPADLQKLASDNRLDLAAARKEVALLKDGLGVARTYRWLGSVDLGVVHERETSGATLTGPTLSLQLPLFNQHQGGLLLALSQLEMAEARREALEIEISNEVALASARAQTAHQAAALYRTRLLPLRERIVAHTQQRANYMLTSAFDLIRTRQEEYAADQAYLEAVRDDWLARAALSRAVGTQLPGAAKPADNNAGPEDMQKQVPMEQMDMKNMKDMKSAGPSTPPDPDAGHQHIHGEQP